MNQNRVIMGTQEGMVPMASPEGQRVVARHLERETGERKAAQEAILKDIEGRGMESLAQTEKRMMKPIADRLTIVADEQQRAKNHLASPMQNLVIYGGFNPENVAKQLKRYVDREEGYLNKMNEEEKSLLAAQGEVVAGMQDIAEGRNPSAEFIQRLSDLESQAAKKVRDSAEGGSRESKEVFASVREELKAFADLKAFAEKL